MLQARTQLGANLLLGDPHVLGRMSELPEYVETVGEQRQLACSLCNLSDGATVVGHLRLANDLLRSGLRLAADCGATFVVSTARATQARVDWFTGQWTGLAERTSRLLDEYRDLFPVANDVSSGCLPSASCLSGHRPSTTWRTGFHRSLRLVR